MQVSDLLQTVKVMLNRSVAFPLKPEQVQKINACIDKLVVGGRVFEESEIDAFLNPVETTPQELVEEVLTDYLTPEQESTLQALVDESQAMGLYEMTGNPLVKDDLAEAASDKLTDASTLLEVAGSQPVTEAFAAAADLEPGGLMAVNPEHLPELPTEGDSAVAETTENTNDVSAANVEPTEPN